MRKSRPHPPAFRRGSRPPTARWSDTPICDDASVEIRSTPNAVYETAYHFVWSTKYRRRVLLERAQRLLADEIREICSELGWPCFAVEVLEDHCHVFVGLPPSISPATAAHRLKGRTSRVLRREIPALRRRPHGRHLWNPSYYAGTAGCHRCCDRAPYSQPEGGILIRTAIVSWPLEETERRFAADARREAARGWNIVVSWGSELLAAGKWPDPYEMKKRLLALAAARSAMSRRAWALRRVRSGSWSAVRSPGRQAGEHATG